MSTKTTNYNLTKLDGSDLGTVIDINGNPDKIDAALQQNRHNQQVHIENKNNPHSVTKAQVGLGNVDNTSDSDKPISIAQQEAFNRKADLGTDGKVPAAQLPSYVDDVLEYTGKAGFPAVGETGKIYVDRETNLTYRWSGSAYVKISPSLALGETVSTAYRGDLGKIAYDHSQDQHARTDATKVESSAINGNIKIDGAENKVYDDTMLTSNFDNLLNASTLQNAVAAGIDATSGGIEGLNAVMQGLINRSIVTGSNTLEIGNLLFQWGASAHLTNANSYTSIEIGFRKPYSDPPWIVTSDVIDSDFNLGKTQIKRIDADRFVAVEINTYFSALIIGFHWLAIGTKATS